METLGRGSGARVVTGSEAGSYTAPVVTPVTPVKTGETGASAGVRRGPGRPRKAVFVSCQPGENRAPITTAFVGT